jgi:hypothetical protein
MATHRINILGAATKPDDSGNVYQEPAAINLQSNDRYPEMVWVFKDSSTRIKLGGVFQVPQNYVGTPKIGVAVAAVPTTGAWRFEFDYTSIADGESSDPSADQESVGATVTVPGTARLLDVQEIALTAGNFAAGDWVQFSIVRDGTDAADTLAASLFLLGAYFSYADA